MTSRIIFCGSRHYNNVGRVNNLVRTISKQHPDITIVTGGATGADFIANKCAEDNNIKTEVYNADWDQYGRKAGMIRNRQMADLNNVIGVVAFFSSDHKNVGTSGMCSVATSKKIPVMKVTD